MTSKAESCYVALLAKLQTVVGVGLLNGSPFVSRRQEDPSRVDWASTPALFINQTGETIEPTKGFEGFSAKQTLHCNVILYVQPVAQEAVLSTAINEMVQAVRNALYPTAPDVYQTLNGIVSHCWISGKIEIIEGVLDNQGFAIIPVKATNSPTVGDLNSKTIVLSLFNQFFPLVLAIKST